MKREMASFGFAIEGIWHGLKTEKHLRFHIVAGFVATLLGLMSQLSRIEWMILTLLIAGMLALEVMNAAIERVVDLVTEDYALLAKQAKDLAAGAVLIYALSSLIIGALLFIPKWIS